MRVLKCDYDPLKGLEAYDDKIGAVREHIEKLHLAIAKGGTSYVAVLDRGGGNIRIASASDMVSLTRFVEDTKKAGEEYASVQLLTINTLQ